MQPRMADLPLRWRTLLARGGTVHFQPARFIYFLLFMASSIVASVQSLVSSLLIITPEVLTSVCELRRVLSVPHQ